jgi:hypothetical protein
MEKWEEAYRAYMAPFGSVKPDRLLVFYNGHEVGVAAERARLAPVIEAAFGLAQRYNLDVENGPVMKIEYFGKEDVTRERWHQFFSALRAYDAGLLASEKK